MIDLTQTIALQHSRLGVKDTAARDVRFADLVERQSRFVFRVAYSLLRNSHDAEDVVQEVFLKLHRTGAWQGMENERGFLARTAWRVALDKLPKTRSEQLDPEAAQHGGANPEQSAVAADWVAAVQRLVDALPPELREPLALSSVEEMSSAEIAATMGIPEGTVRTRILRARQILRQKLAGFTENRHDRR